MVGVSCKSHAMLTKDALTSDAVATVQEPRQLVLLPLLHLLHSLSSQGGFYTQDFHVLDTEEWQV